MTSLEMSGVQISLLKLVDSAWMEILDHPTDAPGWPRAGIVRAKEEVVVRYLVCNGRQTF
jgi:hypothetical protein